jgi:very-short-patch-repair endonuclease
VPEPLWNPRLLLPSGSFLACPDAYVPTEGVAVEVDSKEFHFAAADWERTMRRHGDVTAQGVVVLHFPPSRIAREGAAVMATIAAAIRAQSGRQAPAVRLEGPTAYG